MNWSKEQPTEPGYYWLRDYIFKGMEHFKPQAEPVIVRLSSPSLVYASTDWQGTASSKFDIQG